MTNTHDDTDPRLDDDDRTATESEAESDAPRYASLDLEDGDVVIYDPDNHRAWIQSDVTVEAAAAL